MYVWVKLFNDPASIPKEWRSDFHSQTSSLDWDETSEYYQRTNMICDYWKYGVFSQLLNAHVDLKIQEVDAP